MSILNLDDADLIGIGLHRKCYEHPENKGLCVKVGYNPNIKENIREINYYKFLKRRSISWSMLPRYYGTEITNKGEGVIFDLIRDEDGSVSKTLEYYLTEGSSETSKEELHSALFRLREYLLTESVLTMTLKPKNIVYQKEKSGPGKMIIVDNIGTSEFIPVCKYLNVMAKKKILRKWARFEKLIKSY